MIARTVAGSAAAVALGVAALAWATEGFRVVTAEGARRLAIAEAPRPLPEAALEDQDGRPFRLDDYRGRPVLVEFFYTRCPTVCTDLTKAFQDLRAALPVAGEGAPVLVSITFDPAADTVETIRDYGRAFGADGRTWRFARPCHADDLQRLLRTFGVVVIPDGYGGFDHNAAIHVVDQESRLARVFDLTAADAVVRHLRP